jgi:predicted FMN-binding regulatory protein PaiB
MGITGNIGVDEEQFTAAVNKAAKKATAIKAVTTPDIEKTTLKVFQGLKTGVERMNKTAKATQNICATDTRNMKAIATKIVEEDKAMANILKENTVRFQ